MNYWFIFLSSLITALLYIVGAYFLFPKLGLMDRPEKYGLKRKPIPYYGGIAIVLSFLTGVLIWLKLDIRLLIFLSLGLLIAVVSFVDDFRGIKPIYRLMLQIFLGVALFFSGTSVLAFPNPIGPEIDLHSFTIGGIAVLSLIVTVVWVVMIINTLNWIDGIGGLTSGVTAIAALVMFLLAIKPGIHMIDQTPTAVMALILFVSAFVFWFFDFTPPRMLMGDTGTMFMGFVLAGLAIYNGGKLATAFLVLGFPILDAFWVIARRISEGKSPFKGDLRHFHHRLLYAGFSDRKVLFLIYLMSLIFGLMAVLLGSGQKVWALIILLAMMLIIGFSIVILEVEREVKKE